MPIFYYTFHMSNIRIFAMYVYLLYIENILFGEKVLAIFIDVESCSQYIKMNDKP